METLKLIFPINLTKKRFMEQSLIFLQTPIQNRYLVLGQLGLNLSYIQLTGGKHQQQHSYDESLFAIKLQAINDF